VLSVNATFASEANVLGRVENGYAEKWGQGRGLQSIPFREGVYSNTIKTKTRSVPVFVLFLLLLPSIGLSQGCFDFAAIL
jgi:hypothetical protein